MFQENKYSKIYFKIIANATLEKRIKSKNLYFEVHHIIPRSLGGTDEKTNKVLLTAKEHFICHALLYRAVVPEYKDKMIYALCCMKQQNSNQSRYINSRIYESAKKQMSIQKSLKQKGSLNSQYGTSWIRNSSGEVKKINKDQLEFYLSAGWIKGRIPKEEIHDEKIKRIRALEKKIKYTTNTLNKLVSELDLLKRN
jgi:hypothetical protein